MTPTLTLESSQASRRWDHLNTSTEAKPMKNTTPDNQSAEPLCTQPSPPSPGHAMRAGGSGCPSHSLISSTERYWLFSVAEVLRFCLRVKARADRQRERQRKQRCCEMLREAPRGCALHAAQHVSTAQPSAPSSPSARLTHTEKNPAEGRWIASNMLVGFGSRCSAAGLPQHIGRMDYSSRTEESVAR